MSYLDDISKLKELLDSGAITNTEYLAQKAAILAAQEKAATEDPAGKSDYEPQYGSDDGGQSYGSSDQYGGQPYGNDGQQYGSGSQYNDQQYGSGNQYNGQQHESGSQYNGQQHGSGSQYNGQQYGSGSQYNGQQYNNNPDFVAPKSRLVAGLLGIFLGSLGVHNFYLGYTSKAIAQVLLGTVGWVIIVGPMASGIWGIIEGIMILAGNINVDGKGRPLIN